MNHLWLVAVVAAAGLTLFSLMRRNETVVVSNTRVVKQGTARDMRRAAAMLRKLEDEFKAFLGKAARMYPLEDAPRKILKRWNGKLGETREHAAITENKQRIKVCIRDEENRLLRYDVAKFVTLHELAHVANNSWGHDQAFWTTFKKLLEMAHELEFMTRPIRPGTTFCGSDVGTDPSACVREKRCSSALT